MNRNIISAILLMSLCSCNSQFYYPDSKVYQTPVDSGLKYEDVYFNSKDGTRLNGWFVPSTAGDTLGTVIHFHGNAQNMTAHFGFVSWLPAEGFNLFVFDYRGYGKSDGAPDQRGLFEDSTAAIEYVKSRKDVDPGRIIVLGQSLGGANAIAAVARNNFKGIRAVIIEGAFFSYRSIAQDKVEQISSSSASTTPPVVSSVINDDYSPGPVIDRISPVPLLLIHGTSDSVVPVAHARMLYDKAKEPRELWIIPGAGHLEAFTRYGKTYRPKVLEFMKNSLNEQYMWSFDEKKQ